MGLFGNDAAQQTGGLNLGMTGAPTYGGYGNMNASTGVGLPGVMNQQGGFSQSSNPFASQGMMGQQGMMGHQGMMGQQMQPPSEMEIQMALMRTAAPVDRFIASAQMVTFVTMLNDIVSYSVLEILKNATFGINEEDGSMKMDISSLPQNLQTMSAENVTGQFNNLQMVSQQNIQQAEMQQQQILSMAQQSQLGGALNAAMADPGMLSKVGGGMGSFAKSMIGGR
jgi:hypothetical protein